MTLRSRAELQRSWSLFAGAFTDPIAGEQDRLEAVLGWDPPSEAEAHAQQLGEALELLAEHRGVALPDLQPWLEDLAGISEVARWSVAAFVEHGFVIPRPIAWLHARFGGRVIDFDFAEALQELRRMGLVRGDERGVVVVRRAS